MDKSERQKGADHTGSVTDSINQDVEGVPYPGEGDLDDLDDMLDEFSTTEIDKSQNSPLKPHAAPLANQDEGAAVSVTTDEFSKQLQDQMAALMGNMDESPDMRKEIENIMNELGASADRGLPSESTLQPKPASKPCAESSLAEETFQETIRKTMARMQASGERAGTTAQTEGSGEILAEMLKDMQSGGLGGEAGEEGFSKMLLGVMEQLTNKEILYEPMKELHNNFPGWFEKNRVNTTPEDLKRYEEQQSLVREIVERFEQKDYSDAKAADREFIVERMQQMQAAGNPPADLVGDMSAAQETFDEKDPGCSQQ
ncbi:MAG: hypothetical protein Q9217_004634 [Psora testacea]